MNTTTKTIKTQTLAGFMKGRTWIGHADEAQTFEGAVPREAARQLLSYPIAEASLTATVLGPDGVQVIDMPDRKAIVRTDTGVAFGVFKQGYKIHQPEEWCLNYVDMLLDGGLQIATVAVVNGGARVLLQAQMPETREATATGAEPVKHRPWLSVATSLDGSIATTYGAGTKLLICENELSLAGFRRLVRGLNSVHKVRHTSGSLLRIGEVRANLGLIAEQIDEEFDKEFRSLVEQYISDSQWNEIVKEYTGVDKAKEGRSKTIAEGKVAILNNLWRNDERAATWKNSAYGVLAAFNTAHQYEFGADKGRTERNQRQLIDGTREKFDANIMGLIPA